MSVIMVSLISAPINVMINRLRTGLIVEGNTSGSTTVYVKNAGGSGAATAKRIELITVNWR